MSQPMSGRLPGYETVVITRPELSDEGLKTLQERLKAIVGQFNGEVVLTEDWGKRKLAYPIQRESRGHYTYVVYNGKGDVVHEIERNLRIHEHVLRFLTVNLAKEFDGAEFCKRRTDLQAAAKRREEERESHRDERRGYHHRSAAQDYSHEMPEMDDIEGPAASPDEVSG